MHTISCKLQHYIVTYSKPLRYIQWGKQVTLYENAGRHESDEFAVIKKERINEYEKLVICILLVVGGCIIFSPTKVNFSGKEISMIQHIYTSK